MTHERTEEVRIIVAFADIRDSTGTYERATSPIKQIAPYFDRFDALIAKYQRKTGFDFQDTGDGIMCLVDMDSGHNCEKALTLLGALWEFLIEVEKSRQEMDLFARFGLVRVRVAAGYVLRKLKKDGRIVHRGKPINLAHNTLGIAKDTTMVAHESFLQLVSEKQLKKAGFTATLLSKQKRRPDSVSEADARRLYSLTKETLR
jgi:class 3 adenylate cyclase